MCCVLQKLSNFEEKTVMALCVGMTLVMFTFLKLLRRLPKRLLGPMRRCIFAFFEFLGILKNYTVQNLEKKKAVAPCGITWRYEIGAFERFFPFVRKFAKFWGKTAVALCGVTWRCQIGAFFAVFAFFRNL